MKRGWEIAEFAASLPPQQLATALHDAVVASCASKPVFVRTQAAMLKRFEGLKVSDDEALTPPALQVPVHDFLIGVDAHMARMKVANAGKALGVSSFTRDVRAWRQSPRCAALVQTLVKAGVGLSETDVLGRAASRPGLSVV